MKMGYLYVQKARDGLCMWDEMNIESCKAAWAILGPAQHGARLEVKESKEYRLLAGVDGHIGHLHHASVPSEGGIVGVPGLENVS